MIPLPHDITPKDVGQWLSEGWFYALIGGEYQVSKLREIEVNGTTAIIRTLKNDMEGHPTNIVAQFSSLYAFWPVCGALNIQPGAAPGAQGKFSIFLTRLQKKQWKRTYNSGCLKLRVISNNAKHFSLSPDSYATVHAAFHPEYYSYSQIRQEKFPDGWASAAISPNLVVMNNDDQHIVFLDGEVVGLIESGRFVCANPGIKRRLLPHFDYLVE